MTFFDRKEAGMALAQKVKEAHPDFVNNSAVRVLTLPRGGVPIGFEVAKELNIPLDVIVAHKLGAPENEEFAIGAIAENSSVFLDTDHSTAVSKSYLEQETKRQLKEIKRRVKKYRGGRKLEKLKDKIVILVDDGIATGHTMNAAILLARASKAKKIIVAVPVLPADALESLRKNAEVIFLDAPYPFFAIGRFYENFEQLTDEQVMGYLEEESK